MSEHESQCGGCFTETIPLQVSATHVGGASDGQIVGSQCPNCGRTYLEDLIANISIRLDRYSEEAETL